MIGSSSNIVQNDVKQRTVKVAWDTGFHRNSDSVERPFDESYRPTEEELAKAFFPFGDIVCIGIKVRAVRL